MNNESAAAGAECRFRGSAWPPKLGRRSLLSTTDERPRIAAATCPTLGVFCQRPRASVPPVSPEGYVPLGAWRHESPVRRDGFGKAADQVGVRESRV